MFHRGEVIEVTITQFAFGGKGIAKIPTEEGDYVVFVENTFPGQVVQAKVDVKKKRYAECKLIKVLQRSPDEVVSDKIQQISGAPYIYVPIALQAKYKQSTTLDLYKRIAHITDIEDKLDQYISSPADYNYRNKMEYSFSCIEHDMFTEQEVDDAFALGFKHRGTWWKVENLNKESGMFDVEWEDKLIQIRDFLKATGLTAWHPPKKEGFFRHIIVRKSFFQDQLLIHLVTSGNDENVFNPSAFTSFLISLFGKRIAGIQHTVNDNVADRAKIENGTSTLLYGEPKVIEELNGLKFEISMESFFQTNPKCAELLYNKALDYATESNTLSNEIVMDLFCGTGTIGQLLKGRVPGINVLGVDIVEEAIADAKKNAARNNIEGIQFYAADVGKFLNEYPQYQGKIGTIILDPPRAGIAPKTLKKVIALEAKRLVYISCNPSTQARDAETLMESGYVLEKLTLVDQFPHTSHVEAIAKFIKLN